MRQISELPTYFLYTNLHFISTHLTKCLLLFYSLQHNLPVPLADSSSLEATMVLHLKALLSIKPQTKDKLYQESKRNSQLLIKIKG